MWVYVFKNELTGKVYVGQTTRPVHRRMKEHFHCAFGKGGRATPFHSALRGYGREAFTHSVLQECSTVEELNAAEEAWIKHLDCLWPNGYNMTHGGLNERRGDAFRAKMSAAGRRLFAHMSADERIERSRRTGFGKARGSKLSEETKARISASKKDQEKFGIRPSTAKFTDDEIRSIRLRLMEGVATQSELAREFGISRAVMNGIALGKTYKEVSPVPAGDASHW